MAKEAKTVSKSEEEDISSSVNEQTAAPAAEASKEEIIEGSDGRLYRKNPGGNLTEVFDAKRHANRVLAQIDDGWNELNGFRLSKKGSDVGLVITLFPEEQAPFIDAVRKILANRK